MSIFQKNVNISTNLCQYVKQVSTFRQIYVNISEKYQYFAKSAQKEGSARTRGRVFPECPGPGEPGYI